MCIINIKTDINGEIYSYFYKDYEKWFNRKLIYRKV